MNIDKEILYKFFSQTATIEEEAKLRLWLELSESHKQEFLKERKLYNAILLNQKRKAEKKRYSFSLKRVALTISSVAAAILLIVSITTNYVKHSLLDSPSSVITIPEGQRANLQLPDGTNVCLNAKTTMEYPAAFNGRSQRVVKLNGEAYFDVAKDSEHPFIVQTEKGTVKVLGTKFYLNSYTKSDKFETALIEGSVMVDVMNQKMLLKPLDKAVLEDGILRQTKITDMDEYRWRDGIYSFKETPFDEVLKQFERYYDIKFVMKNRNNNYPKMTGKFRIADGVDFALRILQKEVSFTYERDDDKQVIYIY